MNRLRLPILFVILSLGATAPAQDSALQQTEQELAHVFDRPQGQIIGDEQKQKLAAILARYEGRDLGQLSYAYALRHYLDRDYDAAVVSLDEFFERYKTVENAEHRTMAGRIYLNAVRSESDKASPDLAKLTLWGERMTRLYNDPSMLSRITSSVTQRLSDPIPFRVAIARGVLQSELSPKQKDEFLRGLYAGEATAGGTAGGSVPATALRTRPAAGATAAGSTAGGRPVPAGAVQVGDVIEPFEIRKTLNAESFDLAALRGKVVVLDFFATWCPPCRATVPSLVELQKSAGDDVQVVGVTRFYGRGMDFSPAGSTLPHGGKSVSDLDEAKEVEINEAFLRAFDVQYPLVFTTTEITAQRFGVTGIPTVFVIGRDGKLAGRVVGGSDAAHESLTKLITEARAAGR